VSDQELPNIIIDGVRLIPYFYEVDEDSVPNHALFIRIHVALAGEEQGKLESVIKKQLQRDPDNTFLTRRLRRDANSRPLYFAVVREGIDATPRQMRFGAILWSEKDAVRKYELNLVEQKYDEGPMKWVDYDRVENTKIHSSVAESEGLLDHLLALLIAKGILSEDDRRLLEQVALRESPERLLALREVENIDDWQTPATLFDTESSAEERDA